MSDTNSTSEKQPTEPRKFATNAVQMLRTVQTNTLSLSQMADQKASILMGATFVVFSISVGRALEGTMPYSLGVLAVFAFLSSLSAAWSVMPSLMKASQVPGGHENPLFFGHFAFMDEHVWQDRFLKEMEDEESMFRLMLNDLYQNGLVLQRRKYKYLSYAYRLFVYGMMITLVTVIVEYSTTQMGPPA